MQIISATDIDSSDWRKQTYGAFPMKAASESRIVTVKLEAENFRKAKGVEAGTDDSNQ